MCSAPPPTRPAAWLLALLLLAALPLAGCVVIPIPLGKGHVAAGREIGEESRATIEPGVTTRAEVLARLGEPSAMWDEAGVLVYDWDRVKWLLVWAVGGAGRGAVGATELSEHHLVMIQCDRAGIVRRAEHAIRPEGTTFGAFLRQWAAQGDPNGGKNTTP